MINLFTDTETDNISLDERRYRPTISAADSLIDINIVATNQM